MSFVKLGISDLEFYEKLGGGASGSVYRAKWKSKDKIVAAKKMLTLDKEPEVLSSLSHRNVVMFFGAVTKAPDYCIITEYAELGSLYDFLRKNTLEYSQILLWAKQIAMGMNYLHYEAPIPVIHRDLKSRNVVIAMDLTAKICDFGSSKFHSHTTKMTLVGTFPWMAPEIIQQLPATPACDVFSYSVVLWELLTDEIPFAGLEGMQVAWLVVAKGQRLMVPSSCPQLFSMLMKRCWETEPKNRPTFKRILDALDSMLENEELKEETDSFLQDKSVWKVALDNQMKELQSAERDLSVKQQELDEREAMLREREREFKQQLHLKLTSHGSTDPQPHDVSSWTEEDVANWIYHVGGGSELNDYADLFVKNNISGRRLFLLTGDDLLQIGILSVGHRKELLDEIDKLRSTNYRLLNFPPLPNATVTSPARPMSLTGKEESLVILFGTLYRKQGDSYKWKIFLDVEGSTPATSSVKEVTFCCSHTSKGESQTLHRSPFVTGSWIKKGIGEPVTCTILFKEGVVNSPRSFEHTLQLRDSAEMKERHVQLDMVRRERHSSGQQSSNPFSSTSSIDSTGRTLSPTVSSVHRLSGVWLDRIPLIVPDTMDSALTLTSSTSDADPLTLSSTGSSSSLSSRNPDAYRGQPLQGAWGSNNVPAATIIRNRLDESIPSSRPLTPNSRTSSPVPWKTQLSNQNTPWKPKQSQDLNRSRSSEERTRGGGGKGPAGRGRKGGSSYIRSVSDNSYAQGHYRGRGGGAGRRGGGYPRQPTSEPVNRAK